MKINKFKISKDPGWKFKLKPMHSGSFDSPSDRLIDRLFKIGPEVIDEDNGFRVFSVMYD